MKKVLPIVISIIAICGSVWGAYEYVTPRSEHKLLCMRLEQKITNDRIENYRERIWKLEQWNSCHGTSDCMDTMPREVLEEYLELRKDLDREKSKLDNLHP